MNPRFLEHRKGALSTELQELMDSNSHLKEHYHDVAHARTWSVFFRRKTIELSLFRVMPPSSPCDKCCWYPIRHSHSCTKVVLNKVIIIMIMMTKSQQDERIQEVRETYFNLSMAVWFCRSCFYRQKGHVVASQRAQPDRKSDSSFGKRQVKLYWPILWQNTWKAAWAMQEQGHGKSVPEYAHQ